MIRPLHWAILSSALLSACGTPSPGSSTADLCCSERRLVLLPEAEPLLRHAFSPDRCKVAYVLRHGGKEILKVGDAEIAVADEVFGLTWSENGKTQVMTIGDHAGQPYDFAADVFLSPDGRSSAYRAGRNGRQFVVTGSGPGEPYDRVSIPSFAPDGVTPYYCAWSGARTFLVLGAKAKEDIRRLTHYGV